MAEKKKLALRGIGLLEPNKEVIQALKTWLKWAEKGEIHNLILIAESSGSVTRSDIVGDVNYPQIIYGLTMTLDDAKAEARGDSREIEVPPDDDEPS